jgi:O-antigen/teichoic acid export membrane protein
MSTARVIARNVVSNWFGFVVQAAVTFFLTPFVLAELGDVRFGVWALVMSITGYYGLLDLGFRAGLNQYLTRYLAIKDYARLNQAASSGLAALLVCGFVVALASVVFAAFGLSLFDLQDASRSEAAVCILIVGLSSALQFAFFPFSAIFTATQRFDLSNAIGVATRLVTAGLTWWALSAGYGLVGLAVVNAAGNTLDYLIRWRVAYRLLPELFISYSEVSWNACREVVSYGLWNLLVTASRQLIAASDALVVSFFMPISAVAWYVLATRLVQYFGSLFHPIGWAIYPEAVRRDAAEPERQGELYLKMSQLVALLAAASLAAPLLFAKAFYSLWLGPSYVEPGAHTPVSTLFQILLVAAAATAVQRTGWQVLMALRRQRMLALLMLGEGTLNMILSIALCPRWGLVGVASSTLVSAVIFQGIVHPAVTCRLTHVRLLHYHRTVTLPVLLVASFAVVFLSLDLNVTLPGWPSLITAGVAVLAVSLVVLLAFFGRVSNVGTMLARTLFGRAASFHSSRSRSVTQEP